MDLGQQSRPLLIVGSVDTQVPPASVKAALDVIEREGHPVEFKLIEGAGHGWNAQLGVNAIVGAFLKKHRL